MINIQLYNASSHAIEQLCHLLIDTVSKGASISFLAPLSYEQANAYWAEVITELSKNRLLFIVYDNEKVIGSVQLELSQKPNGRHRAEVQKLMVLDSERGRGIGKRLMQTVEEKMSALGRTLLVLDTREGDIACKLYESMGYIRGGTIPYFARSADGTLHTTVF